MAHVSRLLVVEDDADLRDTLVEQIGLCGRVRGRRRRHGRRGANAAARRSGSISSIMDVGLPDMDGREAVKLIRAGRVSAGRSSC